MRRLGREALVGVKQQWSRSGTVVKGLIVALATALACAGLYVASRTGAMAGAT